MPDPAPAITSDPAVDARLVAEELGEDVNPEGVAGVAVWLNQVLLPAYRERVIALARRCREQRDDPEFDATDGAHTAWWRGCAHGVLRACEAAERALDGMDDGAGVIASDQLQALRVRLIGQREELERLRARVVALEPKCANCGGRVPDDACGMAPILLCEPCLERLSHV